MDKDLLQVGAGVVDRIANFAASNYLLDKKDRLMREQWERQNNYDSPSAQIQRLRAAGLNPDLAYGQLSHGSPVQGIESDIVGGQQISNGVNAAIARQQEEQRIALQDEQVKSQVALNDALANKAEAEAGESRSHASYYDRLVKAQDVLDNLRESQSEYNRQMIAQSIEQIENLKADREWIFSRTFHQDLENIHFDEKLAAELGLVKAQTSNQYASAAEARQHAALLAEQTKQAEELTKVCADKLRYELDILANDKDISDAQRDEAIGRCYEEIYRTMEYRGLVSKDKQGLWTFTKYGATRCVAETVLQYVNNLFQAIGHFYTHHSFNNYTPQSPSDPVRGVRSTTTSPSGTRTTTTRYYRSSEYGN